MAEKVGKKWLYFGAQNVFTFLQKSCIDIFKNLTFFPYIFCKVGFFIEKNAKM